MSKIDRIVNQIKHLSVREIIELTRKLQTDIGKPPECGRVGAYPKRPRPSLKGKAQVLPEIETKQLIEAISKRLEGA